MLRIGFIGGGKMAHAMAKGFLAAGLTKPETLIASCHPADKLCVENFQNLGAETTFENFQVVKKSQVVIISVKPSIVTKALAEVRQHTFNTSRLYLSVVMGMTLKQLEQNVPENARVIRVMPNTPALVRRGASVYVCGSKATPEDSAITKKLFESVGICEEVNESLIDAITALSGSGPAYVYMMIEALADGGVKMGLPRELALKLAAQTVLGSAEMVQKTNTHPGVLKDDVTSPAGSTAAGLHFLEKKGFRAAIIGAVEAATARCREVSENSS